MGLFDRVHKSAEVSEAPQSRAEAEEQIREIAARVVPRSSKLEHFFIVSGNESLIDAINSVFRIGGPSYGGSEAEYRVDSSTLAASLADAKSKSLKFDGQMRMGKTVQPAPMLADVLGAMRAEAAMGRAFVAYVSVNPKGRDWVEKTYNTLLGEAFKQGILPFHMFSTASQEAVEYLTNAFAAHSPVA